MATLTAQSLDTSKIVPIPRNDVLIPQLKHAEKKDFPRHEALDFDVELRKRNVELVTIFDYPSTSSPTDPSLVAYMLLSHIKNNNIVMLHKILVQRKFRRRGLAKSLLESQSVRLRQQGCVKIQLWVDERNMPARLLYKSVGFEEVSKVKDYYAIGRTGISMAKEFSYP